MAKILVVDDDKALLGLLRVQLAEAHLVIETSDPEQALGLALEHKPDAILLDLKMPQLSGFELCQSLRSLSYTSLIPVLVMSGEFGADYQEYCSKLGAAGFFTKPLDFAALKTALDDASRGKKPKQRAHVRLRLRIPLELRGTDVNGKPFATRVSTENVSAGGFLCQCGVLLWKGAIVEVFREGKEERYAGVAEVVRRECSSSPWLQYGFRFKEVTAEWILKAN